VEEHEHDDEQRRPAEEQPLSFHEECARLGIEVLSPEEYGSSAVVWFFGLPKPREDEKTAQPEEDDPKADAQ
jgi:hypothetical protein